MCLLRPAKDNLGLRVTGIYCECGKVYIGHTGRTIEARHKEHMRHFQLEQPEKLAVAEHSIDTAHHIDFNGTSKLCTATRYVDHLVKETIEIQLHPNNFNRDEGFLLSHTWRPVINMLKRSRG
jgi:hypothetical protein